MQIDIDSHSGFCYGVVKTIQLAEEALAEGQPVYCLGEIVHNEEEVERLKSRGLVIINRKELENIKDATVLIRAHGEPSETYVKLSEQSNILKEGTCPIVLQLQKKIRMAWEKMKECNGQVVIYGKKDHAEVVGLAGQTEKEAILITCPEDLSKIDFSRPVSLFTQTTQSVSGFENIISAIKEKMLKHFPVDQVPLEIMDSICRHVSKRGEYLSEFAKNHDVVVFVCGSQSSNGKVLYETCVKYNVNSYWITGIGMIRQEWFRNAQSVGISGATSTPRWLMEKVAGEIERMTKD